MWANSHTFISIRQKVTHSSNNVKSMSLKVVNNMRVIVDARVYCVISLVCYLELIMHAHEQLWLNTIEGFVELV